MAANSEWELMIKRLQNVWQEFLVSVQDQMEQFSQMEKPKLVQQFLEMDEKQQQIFNVCFFVVILSFVTYFITARTPKKDSQTKKENEEDSEEDTRKVQEYPQEPMTPISQFHRLHRQVQHHVSDDFNIPEYPDQTSQDSDQKELEDEMDNIVEEMEEFYRDSNNKTTQEAPKETNLKVDESLYTPSLSKLSNQWQTLSLQDDVETLKKFISEEDTVSLSPRTPLEPEPEPKDFTKSVLDVPEEEKKSPSSEGDIDAPPSEPLEYYVPPNSINLTKTSSRSKKKSEEKVLREADLNKISSTRTKKEIVVTPKRTSSRIVKTPTRFSPAGKMVSSDTIGRRKTATIRK